MKSRSLWIVIGFALLLNTGLLLTNKDAAADPRDEQHTTHLPFVSTAAKPPAIKLIPFASDFEGGTITAIVHAGDARLFVAEREGRIFVVQPDGSVLEEPFLDLRRDVSIANWEEGLLGLTFHPNFPANPHFFVVHTNKKHSVVLTRFAVSDSDANRADEDSHELLLSIPKPASTREDAYRVHNAGDLHFGPDGYLYMAVGDGGPDPWFRGGDPHNSGQGLNELLGNILRIDVNEGGGGQAPDCGSKQYTIPDDNPFADGKGGSCDEVWSIGLRNPYRFSFDRQTGEMFIGEVGENAREEINYQAAGSTGGANYGWHCFEGTIDYSTIDPLITANCSPETEYTMPLYEYGQTENDCSVIGGYVYRGKAYPSLFGRYVFGDFCTGRLWLLNRDAQDNWTRSFANATGIFISTFGEDVHGELYVGEAGNKIHKIAAVP